MAATVSGGLGGEGASTPAATAASVSGGLGGEGRPTPTATGARGCSHELAAVHAAHACSRLLVRAIVLGGNGG
jgi:hypothetical protein